LQLVVVAITSVLRDGIFCVKTPSSEVCVDGVLCTCGQTESGFRKRLLMQEAAKLEHLGPDSLGCFRQVLMRRTRGVVLNSLSQVWSISHTLGKHCSGITQALWAKTMPEMFVVGESLPMLQ